MEKTTDLGVDKSDGYPGLILSRAIRRDIG